jgi:hypothetical protein
MSSKVVLRKMRLRLGEDVAGGQSYVLKGYLDEKINRELAFHANFHIYSVNLYRHGTEKRRKS